MSKEHADERAKKLIDANNIGAISTLIKAFDIIDDNAEFMFFEIPKEHRYKIPRTIDDSNPDGTIAILRDPEDILAAYFKHVRTKSGE